MLAPFSVLATHVLELFLLGESDLLGNFLFLVPDLLLFSLQVISFDREQIVGLVVPEENPDAFEAEKLG